MIFDDECWHLMEQCWAGEPSKRPLLGAILPVLESIQAKAERDNSFDPTVPRAPSPLNDDDDDGRQLPNGNVRPRVYLNNNIADNTALALLAQSNNQRGEVAVPISRRRKKSAPLMRTPKHPGFAMTNFFQTSACSNLYVQMHEF